jgi:hypothetical protein
MGWLVGHAFNICGCGMQQPVRQVREGARHRDFRANLLDCLIGWIQARLAMAGQVITTHDKARLGGCLTVGLAKG